jgi:hypothetical protein
MGALKERGARRLRVVHEPPELAQGVLAGGTCTAGERTGQNEREKRCYRTRQSLGKRRGTRARGVPQRRRASRACKVGSDPPRLRAHQRPSRVCPMRGQTFDPAQVHMLELVRRKAAQLDHFGARDAELVVLDRAHGLQLLDLRREDANEAIAERGRAERTLRIALALARAEEAAENLAVCQPLALRACRRS